MSTKSKNTNFSIVELKISLHSLVKQGAIDSRVGLKTAQLLDRATEQGYLLVSGGKHGLTSKGEKAGVEFDAKSRFDSYYLWP